ncbi:hypothetical protein C0058_06065 [Pseudomonas sp. NC02]|nr:hypothetical protein C0058_06065 [Pseudomonas sp. NC02]QBQ09334.1 hypothetical protein DCC84_06085 [Pseudomonas sp. SXM-1]
MQIPRAGRRKIGDRRFAVRVVPAYKASAARVSPTFGGLCGLGLLCILISLWPFVRPGPKISEIGPTRRIRASSL